VIPTEPFIDQICRQVLWRYLDPSDYNWFVAYEMASMADRVQMDAQRAELKAEILGPNV
jgi:hypothetical protein